MAGVAVEVAVSVTGADVSTAVSMTCLLPLYGGGFPVVRMVEPSQKREEPKRKGRIGGAMCTNDTPSSFVFLLSVERP